MGLSGVSDEVLILAPEREPPTGFQSRVLTRLQPANTSPRRSPRYRRLLAPLAAAAVAASAAAGIVLDATSNERNVAAHYRATLAQGHGSSFEAAPLRPPAGIPAGIVYGYRGAPSWIFSAVDRAHRSSRYTLELVMTSGRRIPVPSFRIDPTTGSAGQAIPVDLHDVSTVRLVGSARGDVLEAQLPHAHPSRSG